MRINKYLFLFCLFIALSNIFTISVFASNRNPNAKVHRGSGDNQSITDIMKETTEMQNENINDEVMKKGSSTISSTVGVFLSILVYLIFAMLGFTTACDLLYIGVSPVRPFLYTSQGQNNQQGMQGMQGANSTGEKKNYCLISNELRIMVDNNQINVKAYFKERCISIIITVAILVILVSSHIFTDIGLNIGQLLYEYFCSLVG